MFELAFVLLRNELFNLSTRSDRLILVLFDLFSDLTLTSPNFLGPLVALLSYLKPFCGPNLKLAWSIFAPLIFKKPGLNITYLPALIYYFNMRYK